MMDRVIRLDRAIIDRVQDAYLWFYDRTGVYVATVELGLFLVSVLINHDSMVAVVVMFLIMALCLLPMYRWQDMNQIERFNAASRQFRDSRFRKFLLVLLVVASFPIDMCTLSNTVCLLWSFVNCVQIRKREPPERHVMAMQGAGS